MSLLPSPDNLWIYVAAIAAWLVLGCLRTIGFEYYNVVKWHNLKVEVHKLRLKQEQRLKNLQAVGEPIPPERSGVQALEQQPEETAAPEEAAA